MRRIEQAELDELRTELHNAGVARVSGLLDRSEVDQLAHDLENSIQDDEQMLLDYGSGGKVLNGFFLWRNSPELARFVCDSSLPSVAAEILQSNKINLFCDNIFFKEPGTPSNTSPWHNDQANWIVDGTQVATIWIALDHVTRESGAMEFAKGSHRWLYLADGSCSKDGDTFEPIPLVGEGLGEEEIICHELLPGDATIHLGNTLHAASGNRSRRLRRRGYAVRYAGDDAVYRPNPSFETPVSVALAPGSPLDSELFPVVFRNTGSAT